MCKKVKLIKMSNFTFFHNVFYAICILKSFNNHISFVTCIFFEFGMVSKWCIREWVKFENRKQNETDWPRATSFATSFKMPCNLIVQLYCTYFAHDLTMILGDESRSGVNFFKPFTTRPSNKNFANHFILSILVGYSNDIALIFQLHRPNVPVMWQVTWKKTRDPNYLLTIDISSLILPKRLNCRI